MSAITGTYRPASKTYSRWAFLTIHQSFSRPHVAALVRTIRKQHDSAEAREFLCYLHWLGTYPVRGSARWNNLYRNVTI